MNHRLGFHNKQMLRGTDLIPTNCACESSFTNKITTGNIKGTLHLTRPGMNQRYRDKKKKRKKMIAN